MTHPPNFTWIAAILTPLEINRSAFG